MRPIYHIIVSLTLALFTSMVVSCSRESEDIIPTLTPKSYDHFFVSADIEEADTKAHLENGQSVKWDVGDVITVFSDLQDPVAFFRLEDGIFEGRTIIGNHFYAFYNAEYVIDRPTTLNAYLGSNLIMVAKSDDNALIFKQTCGLVHFSIRWPSEQTLDYAYFEGNDKEDLAGYGLIDLEQDLPYFTLSGQWSTSTLEPIGGIKDAVDGIVDLYFIAPPMTLNNGFRLRLYSNSSGKEYIKKTQKEVIIKRGCVKSYKLWDIEGEIEENNQKIIQERESLMAIFNALDGENWTNNDNWGSDRPLNEWSGISTDQSGRVMLIDLRDNNLRGTIPDEIGDFEHLLGLDLSSNPNLTGSIPETIGNLTQLRSLIINRHRLSGNLPDSMRNLVNLERWCMNGEVDPQTAETMSGIDGVFPQWIGELTKMIEFDLSWNHFTGTIPNDLSKLTGLNEFFVQVNEIEGPLPVLPQSQYLHWVNMANNYLTGPIPESYSDVLNTVVQLGIGFNCLSGEIPAAISSHPLYSEFVDEIFVNQRDGYGFDLGNKKLPACRHIFDTLDGGTVDLGEQYGLADYTMIMRWAEWCIPSKGALPSIISLAHKFETMGLQTIFAYAGGEEDARKQFMLEMGLDAFPIHIIECHQNSTFISGADSKDHAFWFPKHFNYATPLVEVVDKDGNIVFVQDDDGHWYSNCYFSYSLTDLESFIYNLFNYQEELYDSVDYSADGEIHTMQSSSIGNGINVVLMGDAFSDRLIADGTYESVMRKAMDALFSEEPFSSFKDCFNVYYVDVVSKNEVYYGETALSTWYSATTEVGGDNAKVLDYTRKVLTDNQIDDAIVIVLMNRDFYAGTCYLTLLENGDYGRGASISYFPTNGDLSMFYGMLHHEACGHGFAKLADEYAYEYNGAIPQGLIDYYSSGFPYGWWRNGDFTGDPTQVKWSQFISDSRYEAENIGTYEGAFTCWTGAWRPTEESIMNHNVGGFNAPSRYAIWYRINKLAYGPEWQGTYEDFVEFDKPNRTPEAIAKRKAQRRNYVEKDFVPLAPPVVIEGDWREMAKR